MSIDAKKLSEQLNFKLELLEGRLVVLDEIALHISTAVNEETAKYYSAVLGKYGPFFNTIIPALQLSFYIELHAFLGVKLNKNGEIINDKWATSSVYNLASMHRMSREYMQLVGKYSGEISMIDGVRHKIAHASDRDELNSMLIPGFNRIKAMLNDIASFVMTIHDELHGIPGYNVPHTIEDENAYADHTERLIFDVCSSSRSKEMRERYLQAKSDMRKRAA